MKTELGKRKKHMVLAAAIAALLFVYYQYYLSPLLTEYSAISESMRENEEKLDSLMETEREIDLLLADTEELQSYINALEILVPSNCRVPEIVTQLEACSHKSGTVLQNIVFDSFVLPDGEEKQQIGYIQLPMHIFITGSYENIITFLQEIENSDRLYNVTGFSLFNNGSGAGGRLGMSIDLCAYALQAGGKPKETSASYDFVEETSGRDNPFIPVDSE